MAISCIGGTDANLFWPGNMLREIVGDVATDMTVEHGQSLPSRRGSVIDLTEDETHDDLQAEDEESNAVCRQCELPFYTASGQPVCVNCRRPSVAAAAGAGRGGRSALSPRSPNAAVPSANATSAGRCPESTTSSPTAAAASAQADPAGQPTGLGGMLYSAAAGMLERLTSK